MRIIKLKEYEWKRLIHAILIAIDTQESLIDAHTTELFQDKKVNRYDPNGFGYRVPKGAKTIVNRFKRDIAAFKKLKEKIKECLKD